jgi:hypothetical protein
MAALARPLKDRSLAAALAQTKKIAGRVMQVFRPKSRGFIFAGESGGTNTLGTDDVTVTPEPIRRALASGTPLTEAQDVVAGVALHEAGHAERTPKDFFRRAEAANTTGLASGPMSTLAALIEDPHVESTVLHKFPGFRDFFAKAWSWHASEQHVDRLFAAAIHDTWELPVALPLAVELTRRYTPLTPDQQASLGYLAEHKRRFLLAFQLIADRTRNPDLDPDGRIALAVELAELIVKGRIPARDQPALGRKRLTPPGLPDPEAEPTADPNVTQQNTLTWNMAATLDRLAASGAITKPGALADRLDKGEASSLSHEESLDRDTQRLPYVADTQRGTFDVDVVSPTFDISDPDGNQNHHRIPPRTLHADVLAAVAPHVARTVAALRLRNEEWDAKLERLTRGRLEPRALPRAHAELASGIAPTPFSRPEAHTPERLLIAILQDCSGSMGERRHGGRHERAFEYAVEATVLLETAIRRANHPSLAFAAWGHTTTSPNQPHDYRTLIYRLLDTKLTDPTRLALAQAAGGNYDAEALTWTLREVVRQWPDRRRVLIVISDGEPHAPDGAADTQISGRIARAVAKAKRDNTTVYCLFVGAEPDIYARRMLTSAYGPEGKHFHVVADTQHLPAALLKIFGREAGISPRT